MATTPSTSARFIGRVGALAVALGIGTAIANSPGLASADEGASSDSASSSSSTDSAGTAPSRDSGDAGETTGSRVGAGEADSDDDEENASEDEDDDPDEEAVDEADTADEADTVDDSDESGEADQHLAAEVAPVDSPAVVKSVESQTVALAPVASPTPPPAATTEPVAPPPAPLLSSALSWVRRETGEVRSSVEPAATPVAAPTAEAAATTVSPLATPEQLAAERIAARTANTLPVKLMKIILRQQFLAAARDLYGSIDDENRAAVDRAVDEYAMAAAFQQQLLDSMNPKVVTQVAPPHNWFGQNVPGSRILYDNPDTIYRFMGVNGASEYVITGRFHDTTEAGVPADVTFSVLEGLAGTTSSLLTYDDLEINDDGTFTITVSREPANGRTNHLQLTNGSTIIAARDTLGDWNTEVPMSLSIARVGGPRDSLFAQIGGFAFLGQFVSGNPLLTTLVSLVPPLPTMPPLLRGVFTAAILVVRGANEQAEYMALATNDPETGAPRQVNTVSQPASNAEFLANQRQSNGHFRLADDQALVLTIDPGDADYFIVPAYDIWTITDDYWNQPGSLNNEQAKPNSDGTYTIVVSPTDPGAANWVSTGGLNQGTLALRFQNLPDTVTDPPSIIGQQVLSHAQLRAVLPAGDFVTAEQRAAQIVTRRSGFDTRWAPYPQL